MYAKVQFVVYLEYHLRTDIFLLEALVNFDHCYLNYICGTSLDRRIDGIPFGEGADSAVLRCYVRQISPASE